LTILIFFFLYLRCDFCDCNDVFDFIIATTKIKQITTLPLQSRTEEGRVAVDLGRQKQVAGKCCLMVNPARKRSINIRYNEILGSLKEIYHRAHVTY
jgi:hypothetical protein